MHTCNCGFVFQATANLKFRSYEYIFNFETCKLTKGQTNVYNLWRNRFCMQHDFNHLIEVFMGIEEYMMSKINHLN